MNHKVLPAIDGEWGEVHDHIILDVVTQAEWELDVFGAETAIRHMAELDKLIAKKIWRSAEAADLKLRIIRNMEIYQKYEPVSCIYCGSTDIEAGPFEPEGQTREVTCIACDKYWTEQFLFDCVRVPKEFVNDLE